VKQRQLAASVVAVLLSATASHAQSLFHADEIAVYDAAGKRVGAVETSQPATRPFAAAVAYRYGSRPVILYFLRDEIAAQPVYFETDACTGRAFVDSQGWPGYAYTASAAAGSRRTVYVQSGEFRQRTVRSVLGAADQCEPVASTDVYAPATATDVHLTEVFTPPFSTRPRGTTQVAP
jgi:hypothetical protein